MTKPSIETALAQVSGYIILAGAGKMGGAMLDGWIANGVSPSRIAVIEPSPSQDILAHAERGLRINPANGIASVGALVLAVKPQMFADATPALRAYVSSSTLVVSIMAGTTLRSLATLG